MSEITITRETRTTYRAEKRLDISTPAMEVDRGLYWRPDSDELAHKKAAPFFDSTAATIRASVKNPEQPVSLMIQRNGDEVVAVVEAVTITRK